jgi:hypothetical protein
VNAVEAIMLPVAFVRVRDPALSQEINLVVEKTTRNNYFSRLHSGFSTARRVPLCRRRH